MTRTPANTPVLRLRAVQSRNGPRSCLGLQPAEGAIATQGGHGMPR